MSKDTPPPETEPTPEAKKTLPILFVDDDPESYDLIVGIAVEDAGWKKNETVTTAQAGVDKIQNGSYALVITDGLNGAWVSVAKAAKTKNIPVIILTTEPEVYQQQADKLKVPIVAKAGDLVPNLISAINQYAKKG